MENLVIGIVGPCSSGKTTLTRDLRTLGYIVRHIAQEHSYVPAMWQRLVHPHILVYLAVSYSLTIERRKLDWTVEEYFTQIQRLRHAYENADLYIDTDRMTAQEVLRSVLEFITQNC